jgi:hypothetical protein
VDQVGEERDRASECEDGELRAGGEAEDGEADRDRPDAGAGANDRAVDESVRVPVLAVSVLVGVLGFVRVLGVVAHDAFLIVSG